MGLRFGIWIQGSGFSFMGVFSGPEGFMGIGKGRRVRFKDCRHPC